MEGFAVVYRLDFVFRVAAFFSVVVALSLSGCGGDTTTRPDTAAVSGRVMYNGSPVVGASVSFTAEGASRSANGETNDKGEFVLTTFDTDDGAVLGEHLVTITKMASSSSFDPDLEKMDTGGYAKSMEKSKDRSVIPGGSAEEVKGLLPAKYADPVESGLSRTVVAGEENVFNFDLKD